MVREQESDQSYRSAAGVGMEGGALCPGPAVFGWAFCSACWSGCVLSGEVDV